MVPGTGRVIVEPDVASVRLGVTIIRQTASAAREAAAAALAMKAEAAETPVESGTQEIAVSVVVTFAIA